MSKLMMVICMIFSSAAAMEWELPDLLGVEGALKKKREKEMGQAALETETTFQAITSAEAMFKAVSEGHHKSILRLINRGCSVNCIYQGLTPLHVACQQDCQSVAALLLWYGAKVDAISYDGLTPLMTAVGVRSQGLVKLLCVNNATLDLRDFCGNTALRIAEALQEYPIIVLLKIASMEQNKTNNLC